MQSAVCRRCRALFEVGQVFPRRRRSPTSAWQPPACDAATAQSRSGSGRHWAGQGCCRSMSMTPRPDALDAAGGARASPDGRACRSCRAVPSFLHPGPLRCTLQARPQDHRSAISARSIPTCCDALGRAQVRSPVFEITLDALPAAQEQVRPKTQRPKLVLCRTSCRSSATSPSWSTGRSGGRARRRGAGADRGARGRGLGVRRLRGQGRAGGAEVDCAGGDAAAEREDAHRRRDRCGRAQDRRGGDEEDRAALRG